MSWSELYLGPGTWIVAVLAGGLLGMDSVSWPQVMISRPIVSATLGGWLMGDPVAGMIVGAVLEVYSLRHPPFGAARYPDTGPAGLVAGASFAAGGGASMGALLVSTVIGWALGWLGTVTVQVRRRLNERITSPVEVLAADEKADVAIFRIRARDLPYMDLAQNPVPGTEAYVMSHPQRAFYTFTRGSVARYSRNNGLPRMEITADYATGSSGGPVVNAQGQVIGIVCSTTTLLTSNDENGSVQMVRKSTVPVAEIRKRFSR